MTKICHLSHNVLHIDIFYPNYYQKYNLKFDFYNMPICVLLMEIYELNFLLIIIFYRYFYFYAIPI